MASPLGLGGTNTLHVPAFTTQPVDSGFGQHFSPGSTKELLAAERKKEIMVGLTMGSLVITVCFGTVGLLSVTTGMIAAAAAPCLFVAAAGAGMTAIFSIYCLFSVLAYKKEQMKSVGVFNANPLEGNHTEGRYRIYDGRVSSVALDDSVATHTMRKEMIKSAHSSIILSGNICGGESFDEILELIDERMKKKESLRVVLLSSSMCQTKSNREKLNSLQRKFPRRFELIRTDKLLHYEPGLKVTMSHVKALVVDWKYAILGGSLLLDSFTRHSGLNHSAPDEIPRSGGLVERLLAGKYRDQDWAFSCKNPSTLEGSVDSQILYLARQVLRLGVRSKSLSQLDVMTQKFKEQENQLAPCLALDMLKESYDFNAVTRASSRTQVGNFDSHLHKVEDVRMQVFATGPEQGDSSYLTQLVRDIDRAKESIVIAQFYFHPPDVLLNALANAAKRGIKIRIISNGLVGRHPPVHQFFVPRSLYNFYQLCSDLPEEARANIRIFQYSVEDASYHKKVMVVDDIVYGGSSNWGYKSLQASDWELNFRAESSILAYETRSILVRDRFAQNSQEVRSPDEISLSTAIYAAVHRLCAPLVG